jgi:hypothetical protein
VRSRRMSWSSSTSVRERYTPLENNRTQGKSREIIVRTIQCPECNEEVALRDAHSPVYAQGSVGALCACGYMAYGHLKGDQLVIEDELPSPRSTRQQTGPEQRT